MPIGTQEVVYRTAEEFKAALAKDGVPVDHILTPCAVGRMVVVNEEFTTH
jgi:hypothetical protein